MFPCYCVSSACNGALQKRSTRNYHLQVDRKHKSLQGLSLRVPTASSSSQTPISAPIPAVTPQHQQPSHGTSQPTTYAPQPTTHAFQPPTHVDYHTLSYVGDSLPEGTPAEHWGHEHTDEVVHEQGVDLSHANDDIGETWEDTDEESEGCVRPEIRPMGDTMAPGLRTTPAPNGQVIFTDVGDPATPNENFPDPFEVNATNSQAADSAPRIDGPIFLLYLLVSWLHTHFHLPFLACNTILTVFVHVVRAFGTILPPGLYIYTTLGSVLPRMGIEPKFDILPVCPNCLEVYPSTTPPDTICSCCASPLFRSRHSLNRRASSTTETHRPSLQFPTKSIESQLRDILAVPGMEEVLEGWRSKHRTAGVLTDIFDGDVCKTLPAPDGSTFFANPLPPGVEELRIGLTLGVDWFSYLRSLISPSHSSCPMSFVIANLPHFLKYRTANVMLVGIMPGPKEQNPDQIQRFMRVFVNELIRLWRHGFIVNTSKHPNGILVRVALLCVICDKPAAHKLGGFGSHSHTFFCTRCWIRQSEKNTSAAFQAHAFPPRTHAEQKQYAEEYQQYTTQATRDDHVKQYATRWSELLRLPYFDICRMIIVDPMHNLLLGLVKTHFYHIWIQQKVLRKTRELRRFHDLLAKLQIPSYLGRLPSLMGVPAGGSLTADQWLVAATIVCPIIIPQIWEEYCTGDREAIRLRRIGAIKEAIKRRKEVQAAARKARHDAASEAAPRRPQRKRKRTERAQYVQAELPEDDPEDAAQPDAGAIEEEHDIFVDINCEDEDVPQDPNLHPDDPAHFGMLTKALRLLLGHEIRLSEAEEADALLRGYGLELLELYGPEVIRPNHHYATHVLECVRDFGPLHEFWTFLYERINKVLKSYKTSNHAGGELETSFFREFHRTVQLSRVMAAAYSHGNSQTRDSVAAMYRATSDDRGTVQALAREVDEATEDGGLAFCLSQKVTESAMTDTLYAKVFFYLRERLHLRRRFYAQNRTKNTANSFVMVDSSLPSASVGELLDIITLKQVRLGAVYHFGHIRWLVPAVVPGLESTFWATCDSSTRIWIAGAYNNNDHTLIPLSKLRKHFLHNASGSSRSRMDILTGSCALN
ncbi:hypothetical protein AB1N83_009184 [Pleurotus pulmonarius]